MCGQTRGPGESGSPDQPVAAAHLSGQSSVSKVSKPKVRKVEGGGKWRQNTVSS